MKPVVPVTLPAFRVSNPGAAEPVPTSNVPPFIVSPLDPKAAELEIKVTVPSLIIAPPVKVAVALKVKDPDPFLVKLKLPPDWPIAPNLTKLLLLVTVTTRLPVSVMLPVKFKDPPELPGLLALKPMSPLIVTAFASCVFPAK